MQQPLTIIFATCFFVITALLSLNASVPVNYDVVPKYHTIKKGEDLKSIGHKYKVSEVFLKRWNRKQTEKGFDVGQVIVIGHVTELKDISKVVGKKVFAPVKEEPIYYKVMRGESLLDISEKFDEDITDLILWNDLYLTVNLRPGQKIIRGFSFKPNMKYIKDLYNRPDIAKALGRKKTDSSTNKKVVQAPPKKKVRVPTPPPPPTPKIVQQRSPTPVRQVSPRPVTPTPVLSRQVNPNFIYHQMQVGETLYEIAGRYGVTINQLFQWNNIDARKAFVPTGESIIVGLKQQVAPPNRPLVQEPYSPASTNQKPTKEKEELITTEKEIEKESLPEDSDLENNHEEMLATQLPTEGTQQDTDSSTLFMGEEGLGEMIEDDSTFTDPTLYESVDSLYTSDTEHIATPSDTQAESLDFPILESESKGTQNTQVSNPKRKVANHHFLKRICEFVILTTILSLIGIWLIVWGKRIFFPAQKTDQHSSKRQRTRSLLQKIARSYNHPDQAEKDILAPFRSGSEIHLTQDALLQIFPSGFFLRSSNRKVCVEELVKIKKEQPQNTDLFKAIYLLLDLEEDSLKKLRGTDIELQMEAIDELTYLEYNDAQAEIKSLINHPQAGLRTHARFAMIDLANLDDHTLDFVNELQQPLTNWEQLHIMQLLKQKRSTQTLPDFSTLINSEKKWQTQFALRLIAEFQQNSSIPDVLRLLHDEDTDIKRTAIHTLGKLHNDIAVPTLKELYQQTSEMPVKKQIISALSNVATEEDIPFLEETLQNGNYEISFLSAKSLMTIGNKGLNSLLEIKKQADQQLIGIINRAQYHVIPK